MKNKFSKFINLQGKYLTSLLILLAMSIGNAWGAITTEVYDASGASSSVTMTKTGSTLAGTYIAGQGGGAIQGYSPSNKGVKLRTQTTKVTLSDTQYGYAVITANSGYALKSFKLEGTSNGSNSIDLLGVYVDVDATNATTLAADLATATNQLSSTVTIPNKNTTYVSSPELSINASSNIVMLFPGSGDNQMRAIITIGYEEASSGIPCTDATVSFAATSDAIEIGSGESSASTSLTFSSDNASTASYAVTKGGAATTDASVTGTTFTATAAGEYVVTVTQAKDETNNICAVEETETITVTDANIVLPGASLTAHTPGKYESPTGYNVALTEYNEREYETYFFSYSSSKVYLGIGASYVTDNTTPRLPGFDGVANGDLTSTDNWLNINAAGFSGSNTSPAAEFAVSHSDNSTHYAQIKEGNDFIIKVQGYDQFSFGGRENGSGSGKQFVVTLNGVEQTISHSSTDWNLWRFDLNPATEYIIMVSGDGSNANRLRAFSLRLPEVTKYDVAFAGGDYGTGSMTTLKYKEGATVTAPACGFASSDATKEFDKWGVTGVAGTTEVAVDGTFAMPAGNVTLTALWKDKAVSSDATLSDLKVNGETVEGFDPATIVYNVVLPMGTTAVPTVAGTANDVNAKSVVVTDATALPGATTVVVTAENDATKTYTINFSVATTMDLNLVFKTGTAPCKGTPSTATQILSNNAAVSTYINQITFTNVEGSGDNGAEGSSLNVGKKAGNMFTLSAKAGYAFEQMHFLAKIQDANCEFSLDGGAWQTLTSTNTSGDECYCPFATGEVHEFRLRSTGTSGVWIRNMQLTMIEACTPVALAWDEEPVEFEVGKAGQAIAATANNGGTIAYGSSNGLIIAVDAGNGVLSVSDLGSVTLSASTAEGDGTTYCANGGSPIVINKSVNTYYLVQFDPQNETAVSEIKYFSGDAAIALPSVSYLGHTFQGWFDAPTGGNEVTSAVTPTASVTLYAQWTADCAGPTIDVQPASDNYLTGRVATALSCEATAGNAGALTYTWYSCDDDARTNPVELAGAPTPNTTAAGTFYYFCAVTEEGCAVIVNSDVATIVVADKDAICLIKATHNGGATTADVEGKIGGTYDKNTQSGGKLGSNGHYFGVKLAEGTFQAGDIVEIYATTTSTKVQIFSDKGENMLDDGVFDGNYYHFTLTAATEWIYLYRTSTAGSAVNPTLGYIAVYRPSAPILKSVTVAGVEGTPDALNNVVIEVPASTTDAAFAGIVYDWISNDDAWTANPANAPVAANAWEFGVANPVTFTDKDGDASVYNVTVNKAAISSDATLSALSYGDPATAIALADGVYTYNIELLYGTSAVPALSATPNHIGASIHKIVNASAFVNRRATSTVTVMAEDGSTTQVYTVNFVVARSQDIVLWDGSTMTAVVTNGDASLQGITWASTGVGVTSFSAKTCEDNGKSYTKALDFGGKAQSSRQFSITIPDGKVAKLALVCNAKGSSARSIFVGNELASVIDEHAISSVERSSNTDLFEVKFDIFAGGTLFINATDGFHIHEIRIQMTPGYYRSSMLGKGVYGTVCVPNNVPVEDIHGVKVYELAGKVPPYGKIAFDEIVSGQMEAGVPHVFQAIGNHMTLLYGETSVSEPVDNHNGMYGTFTDQVLTELDDVYYFAEKALWSCAGAVDLTIPANRAYVKLSEIPDAPSAPAPGRARMLMNVNGHNTPTGINQITNDQLPITNKVIINGQLFILRGEKMYDATGRLVK